MTRFFIAAVLVVAGCGSKEEPSTSAGSASSQATIQAAVVKIETVQVPVRVEVTGQVTAIFQAMLSSRIQGTIDKLHTMAMIREWHVAARAGGYVTTVAANDKGSRTAPVQK